MKKSLLPLFRLVVILLCLLRADLSAQTMGWVKQLGGIARDNVSDMVVDKDGNIFITGTFDYIADFDPGTSEFLLTSKGLSDVFVAKYDSLGNFVWANQFGSVNEEGFEPEMAIDLQGVPYLLCRSNTQERGVFYTTTQIFDYSATSFSGYNWYFVLQLSPNGQVDKIQVGNFKIWGLEVDKQRSIYFKVELSEVANANAIVSSGVTTTINTSSFGEYLLKLKNFNKVEWFVKIGSGNRSGGYPNFEKDPFKVDALGNAYVLSSFTDVFEFTVKDTVMKVIAVEVSDQLISCIDSTGKVSWVKQLTGAGHPKAFALDSIGQLLLCGEYDKRLIFNPATTKEFLLPIASNTTGFYLAKMSRLGELLVLKNIDNKLVPSFLNFPSEISIGSGYVLVADLLSPQCFFRLFTLDFDLVRNHKLPFSNIYTSTYYGKQLVHFSNNKVLFSGVFSKKQDFDPSCKEYNISSFINSADIFLLNINLDQIDSTVYKISGQKKICFGDSLSLSFPPNLKYTWSTGEATSTITAKPSKVGLSKYAVTVENAEGCIFKDSVSITVLAAPQLVGGGDQSICLGQSTQLLATGATSYAWSTGQTDSSIVVQPLLSTAYVLTLTNANGCSTVDTIQVKVNPPPKANAGADQSICVGDSAVLEALGGTQYYWNNLKLQAKQIVKPTTTTNYSVVVTDVNGCAATDEVVVNVYPNPDVDLLGIDTLKLKVGQFVILYAGKGQKFLWNTGDTANTIIIDQKSGSYCVTVTSAFGCQGSDCLFVQFTPTANQEVNAATVNIYPNPAQDFLTIAVRNSTVLPYDLQLFNALGQSVKQVNHITIDQQNLDISDLAADNYFVHLRFEGYIVVEQVVVRRY